MGYLNKLSKQEIKDLLDLKVDQYNQPSFIENDPISIPHQFTKKEDIEISALIIALISWGNRKMILKNGKHLLEIMEYQPHEFVMNYNNDFVLQTNFVHRTFNVVDLDFILRALRAFYSETKTLEDLFYNTDYKYDIKDRIMNFRNEILAIPHEKRSEKHLSNPLKGSAAKRINMFLRWMVRRDNKGVDFGIWKSIEPAELYLPLDVHSGRIARELGLLNRKQDDWKALEELMNSLREFDPSDPCKYDYALFGIGVNNDL